jgi:holliday junction DNA helicase RuvA
MIDIVQGHVAKHEKDYVVVMVGGIGLRVSVPRSVLQDIRGVGDAIMLFTHFIVREDGMALFGFASEEERTVFETLLTVSGVGPKMALSILSTLSTDHLRNAIAREEPQLLTRVPGVGKKTAEKIVFELKGKLESAGGLAALGGVSDTDAEVIDALTALGYSIVEAQQAIQSIPRDAPKDVPSRVMLALQYFA